MRTTLARTTKQAALALALAALALPAWAGAGQATASSETTAFLQSLVENANLDQAIAREQGMLHGFVKDPQVAKNTAPAYRKKIEAGPTVRFLYAEPTGVSEGYSVGQHTERVLNTYAEQKGPYGIATLAPAAGVTSWDRVMTYTLAFHDIGKSIAYRGGDKDREIVFSAPISEVLFPQVGLTNEESRIAVTLVRTHQLIGSYLQNEATLEATVKAIDAGAVQAAVERETFFKLAEIVFVCDAGSYPFLRGRIFTNRDGKLVSNNPKYSLLTKAFIQGAGK